MISSVKKHTKHANLTKPQGGEYHRKEWTIIGAPCGVIQEISKECNRLLKAQLKIGFVDASHAKGRRSTEFHSYLLDKISHRNWQSKDDLWQKQNRKFFQHCDLVFVNGNHFHGDQQIVIMHEKKKESLLRKLDRLTNVKMILLEKPSSEIYPEVIEKMENPENVPVFRMDQYDKIAHHIFQDFMATLPPLYGLVLTGGKSTRMGEDKGAIDYHGKEQREYEAELISNYCHRTFLSMRKNQDELIETTFEKIYDSFERLGPYGGILSAFRHEPNAAWLTLAADLPYIDKESLDTLVGRRNPSKLATCFYNPETDFPEPLITIWEPRAYPVLLEFLSMGYSCPRKVLINSEIEMITLENPIVLKNANTPQEAKEARLFLLGEK